MPGAGIPLGMTTIAQKLKGVGYRTHQIGKWCVPLPVPVPVPVPHAHGHHHSTTAEPSP